MVDKFVFNPESAKEKVAAEHQALEVMEHVNVLVRTKTCPIFKKKCLGEQCASFYGGRVATYHDCVRVYFARCNNALVTGSITHEEE